MPAPLAMDMSQKARTKFMSFQLKVPSNWQQPSGEDGKQYNDAFADNEKAVAPGSPPLFLPATANKYHVDSQKMHIAKIGKFIDDTTKAICSAWSTWQSSASIVGITIAGPSAIGGQVVGPPIGPLIMAQGPKNTPNELKFTTAIANTLNTAWTTFTATIKIPGLPWWPAYSAVPSPVAPPVPNVPDTFGKLVQVPASIMATATKPLMIAALGDPQAPFHKELFESIATAFEQCYDSWKMSCQVTNVMPTLAPTTFAPPAVPVGVVVGGQAIMPPGGFV
ncbi:MAG: hypothetical protein QM831_39115 [Kofleriaceae bacterium]